jgi:uncharacterized membrane protein (UPF0127 family)
MRLSILCCLALLGCTEPQIQQKKTNSTKASAVNADTEDQSQKGLPKGKVILTPENGKEVTVRVEIAADQETRRMGLMFRQKLADDEGMIFLFNEEDHQSFWMKNTYLPLDMIFIKSDMTVLGVCEGAVPLTTDGREVPGNSQYVLEVNANFAHRHEIKAGTKVRFIGTENIQVQ